MKSDAEIVTMIFLADCGTLVNKLLNCFSSERQPLCRATARIESTLPIYNTHQ